MNNLEMLLEELLDEGRFEVAQKKYPEAADVLAQLKSAGVDSKFAQWFGKQWTKNIEPWRKEELSIDEIVDLFKSYNDLLNKKLITDPQDRDINQFGNWVTWVSFVEQSLRSKEKKEKEKAAANDADIIYDDGQYLIVHPNSTEASCKFGRGTKWCISAKEENMFAGYRKNGANFFFFINKKTNDKDALVIYPDKLGSKPEVFDAADKSHDLTYLRTKYPENLHEIFDGLIFGKETIAQIKEFLQDPIGQLDNLLSDNIEASNLFFRNAMEKFGDDVIIQATTKILSQLQSENDASVNVKNFIGDTGFYFDSDDVNPSNLWKLYEASKKFLTATDEDFLWNGAPIPIVAFSAFVYKIARSGKYDTPSEMIQVMKAAIFLAPYAMDSEFFGKFFTAINTIVDLRSRNDVKVFEVAQQDPQTFVDFMICIFDFEPDWAEYASYAIWVGEYIAGKYNIEEKTAANFVGNLPKLWKIYLQIDDPDKDAIFAQQLPDLLEGTFRYGKYPHASRDEAIRNAQLFVQLIKTTQGKRNKLVDDRLVQAYNESMQYKAVRMLRNEMKRFFPSLIRD